MNISDILSKYQEWYSSHDNPFLYGKVIASNTTKSILRAGAGYSLWIVYEDGFTHCMEDTSMVKVEEVEGWTFLLDE